jgi:hypothetical protein
VTDEPAELVAKWIARAKPTYPVAILKNADKIEEFLGVQGFPSAGVVGPDGLVTFAGLSWNADNALDKAHDKAKKTPLWPKSLGKVAKLASENGPAAYAEIKKLIAAAQLPAPDQKVAESFRDYLEARAAAALAEARAEQKDGFIARASARLTPIANADPPFPATGECAQLLKELQALPEYKKEVAGGAEYDAVEELLEKGKFLEAIEKYKAIGKKYAGTHIAENAMKDARHMFSDGLAGYEPACPDCQKKRRACDRHEKEVKL